MHEETNRRRKTQSEKTSAKGQQGRNEKNQTGDTTGGGQKSREFSGISAHFIRTDEKDVKKTLGQKPRPGAGRAKVLQNQGYRGFQ